MTGPGGYQDIWFRAILGVSTKVFLDEINIWICRLNRADCPPDVGRSHPITWSPDRIEGWILFSFFPASINMIMWFFSFLVHQYSELHWLIFRFEAAVHIWNETHLVMKNFFRDYWILFVNILKVFLCLNSWGVSVCSFLSVFGFGTKLLLTLYKYKYILFSGRDYVDLVWIFL